MSARIYLGDSVVVTDTLTTNGVPVDLTGAEVVLSLTASGDATIGGPATINDPPTDGSVTFTGGLATAAGTFGGRWIVTSDGVVTSYPAPTVRVVDPACQWASPADVAASAGAEAASDIDAVLAAIDAAQALLSAFICEPVECPVPDPIRWATASIAAQLLTRPTPGTQPVVAETIGDYSYRLAAPTQVEAVDLINGVRGMIWPWLCGWARVSGTIVSPRVWPPEGSCATCGQWALGLTGGCGCGCDEYQVDAEGLMRS